MAYLDDGTMVVVDNARKMIGKTLDIVVTSVLQTTAGKMIFGRFIETSMPAHVGRSIAVEREKDESHRPRVRPRSPSSHSEESTIYDLRIYDLRIYDLRR